MPVKEVAPLRPVVLMFALMLAGAQPAAAPAPAEPVPLDQVVRAQLDALDTGELERFLRSLDDEVRSCLPDFRAAVAGRKDPTGVDLAGLILTRLARELTINAHLLGELILLAVLCGLLTQLGGAFAAESLADLAYHLCYLVMLALAIRSFATTVALGRQTLDDMVGFNYALLPVVCSLMAAVGGNTTSALLNPTVLGAVTLTGHLARTILFPLTVLTAGVTFVGHLSEGFSLSKLASLLREVTIGAAGLILAGFVGLLAVRGVAAAAADGVALRAAKYASGTFVPVVGKGMSDAMETVAGCALVLKNAVGGFGAWTLVLLIAFPMVKILAVVAIYRLAAALIQPLGQSRMVEALHAVGNSLITVFAVTAIIGLTFLLGLTILVALGNLTYALR